MAKLNLEDATLLAAALEGLELQRTRLDEQIERVKGMLGKSGLKMAAEAQSIKIPEPARKRRRLSAEGRARIAEAQRRRWAAARRKPKAVAARAAEQ